MASQIKVKFVLYEINIIDSIQFHWLPISIQFAHYVFAVPLKSWNVSSLVGYEGYNWIFLNWLLYFFLWLVIIHPSLSLSLFSVCSLASFLAQSLIVTRYYRSQLLSKYFHLQYGMNVASFLTHSLIYNL